MVIEFGALIKGEIEKPKLSPFQDIKWRGEIRAINFHYFRDGGRVWDVNKGWNWKTETYPFSGYKIKGGEFCAKILNYFRDGGRVLGVN